RPAPPRPWGRLRPGCHGWHCHYPRKTPSEESLTGRSRASSTADGAPTTGTEHLQRRYSPIPRLINKPRTMTARIHVIPSPTVIRSRLRSTTDDPPSEEVTPPPNMSERPPPFPLCISTRRISRTLRSITKMDRPRITRSPVARPRSGGIWTPCPLLPAPAGGGVKTPGGPARNAGTEEAGDICGFYRAHGDTEGSSRENESPQRIVSRSRDPADPPPDGAGTQSRRARDELRLLIFTKTDHLDEFVGLQASTTDQPTVDIVLGHDAGGVVALDRTAVQQTHRTGHLR